ncbi:MAG TPA: hypothetical protein VL442_05810 [Mucilaginibacter sp.]|jgi:hypothetical protein|nr:hypothetical protein [Mucilaginibacter sp.]
MESAEVVKSIIENMVCPFHDVHPVVEISGNELQIGACCAEFHEECANEAKGLFMLNKEYPYWVLQD